MSMKKVLRIERTSPRGGIQETPKYKPGFGYILGHPKNGGLKYLSENAIYAKTLDEAAFLVESGLSLRMGRSGIRESLIVIAHPTRTIGSTGSLTASTKRTMSRTEAPLAFAVLTTERKAA